MAYLLDQDLDYLDIVESDKPVPEKEMSLFQAHIVKVDLNFWGIFSWKGGISFNGARFSLDGIMWANESSAL